MRYRILCDPCAAEAVKKGQVLPLKNWPGPNEARYDQDHCEHCGLLKETTEYLLKKVPA